MNTIAGTERYMAPEQQKPGYGHKVDVFAFGMLANEVCTNAVPFKELDNSVQVALSVREGKRPQQDTTRPAALNTLIAHCWDADPEKRPEFALIMQELVVIAHTSKLPGRPITTGASLSTKEAQYCMQIDQSACRSPKPSPATSKTYT